MGKKNKHHPQVVSVQDEEEHHDAVQGLDTGWGAQFGSEWDQGGLGQDGLYQNQDEGWQNAPAPDSYVQPGDSISNASSNSDWEEAAPTPPTKDVPMQSTTNDWAWGSAANEPAASSATKGRHQKMSAYGSPVAMDMQNMLSAIAEQRQAQHNELTEKLRQVHQLAPEQLAHGHQNAGRRRSKHAREANGSWGATWGQASDMGTSQNNRAPAETNWGDANADWAGTGEGTNTSTKSKRKRSKGKEQQTNVRSNSGSKNDDWGNATEQSSWGAGGVWDAPSGAASTSVAPGGFGAGTGGWGADSGAKAWGTSEADAQAPAMTQSQSWGAWTDTEGKEKIPKSGLSGLFSRIFRGKDKKKKEKERGKKGLEKGAWVEDTKVKEKKKRKEKGAEGKVLKKQKFAEPEATTWPTPEEDEEDEDYEEVTGAAWGTGGWGDAGKGRGDTGKVWGDAGKVWADPAHARTSKASDSWGDSPHTKTSKAYAYATDGRVSETGRPRSGGHGADHRIAESNLHGLQPAQLALFSKERLARDRILWFFDPNKDPRVSSVLTWIQHMQVPLAMFGFSRFLDTRERGALFTNVEYRSPSAPHEPAFDWLTFDQIQPTMDRIFQESLAFYDPSSQIVVFAFLLSKSKRSMAIWRRKLPLPENIRHTYGTQITRLVGTLKRQYPIRVDELPATTPGGLNQTVSDSKKNWLMWGRP